MCNTRAHSACDNCKHFISFFFGFCNNQTTLYKSHPHKTCYLSLFCYRVLCGCQDKNKYTSSVEEKKKEFALKMITIRFTCGVLFLLIFNILWISDAKDVKTDFTTSPTPITTLQRTTSVAEGINADAYREGLTKRDTKAADQSASPSVSAKSYDPPPEFYRLVGTKQK